MNLRKGKEIDPDLETGRTNMVVGVEKRAIGEPGANLEIETGEVEPRIPNEVEAVIERNAEDLDPKTGVNVAEVDLAIEISAERGVAPDLKTVDPLDQVLDEDLDEVVDPRARAVLLRCP